MILTGCLSSHSSTSVCSFRPLLPFAAQAGYKALYRPSPRFSSASVIRRIVVTFSRRDHFSDQHQMDSQTTQPVDASVASASAVHGVAEQPWYAAYPEARSKPKSITRKQVLQLLKGDTSAGESYVLVDLRRTDYEASASCPLAQTGLTDRLNSRNLTLLLGRNDPRLHKLASSESLADHSLALQHLQSRRRVPGDLVLR